MTTLRPRHPALRLFRLGALAWFLLSLLGIVAGLLGMLVAASWGCVGSAAGWLPCTLAVALVPLAATGSAFTAGVVLFFAQLFHMGGANVRSVDAPRRGGLRGAFGSLLADLFD